MEPLNTLKLFVESGADTSGENVEPPETSGY